MVYKYTYATIRSRYIESNPMILQNKNKNNFKRTIRNNYDGFV